MAQNHLLHPLTSAQQGLWYAQQLDPSNAIFNTAHYTEIHSALELSRFQKAVNTVLAQADGLRLRVNEPTPFLELNDTIHSPEKALAWMQAEQKKAIDLYTEPAARFVLFCLAPNHYIFYMRVHHLAADGYAMNLIEARCIQHYLALLHEQPQPAPLNSVTALLAEETAYEKSAKYQKDKEFWLTNLSADQDIASLADKTAHSASTFLSTRHLVNAHFSKQLISFAHAQQSSWADVLTLLTAAYIARHTGQYKSVFGVPYMGRMGNSSALTVATVMNVAPLPLSIDERLPIREFLQEGSQALARTRRHGRYRSEQLRRDLGLLANGRRLHGPLINILPFDTPYANTELDAKSHVLCAGPVEDITFTFRSDTQAQGMSIEIEANPNLYEQAEIDAHAMRLVGFIKNAWKCERLEQVATLSPAEYSRYVVERNQTAHPVAVTTLSQLIKKSAPQQKSRTALYDDNTHYTYKQYQEMVEQFALQLHAAGVRKKDIVAVAMERRADMVLLLHAVMRAGAAYLPLDLSQPNARLLKVLQQAQPRICISDERFANDTELPCRLIHIDQLPAARLSISSLPYPEPTDAAYVLFTSGSTGEPKGVVISHQAIVNRLMWMRTHYQITAQQRFIQKTPYTFDVSLWELFLPFISAAALYVAAPDAHKDPQQLAKLIVRERITVIHFVPSMLTVFLAEPQSHGLTIPLVFCSGEALTASLRDQFYQVISGQLHNLYGPTEAAVDVSYWHASADDSSHPVPIGFPVWNTTLYILDSHLRPVPPGIKGDLYIGGIQLAEGYLGRPDLTQASFMPNPFGSGRIYKTGDMARWRTDGAIEYLGRSDAQIKLRGLRIELGEIEQVLGQHHATKQVAVILREDSPTQQQIVAYIVPSAANKNELSDELLTLCRQQLPDYMVPNVLVFLDALPLSSSGKLDRSALPAPQRNRLSGTPLSTATEKLVAQLFQQQLQLPAKHTLYKEDNFFALGGHSLLAAQLIAALREQGYPYHLGVIFAHPTVAQLALYLDQESPSSQYSVGFEPVLRLHQALESRSKKPALFCIHPAGGLSWCYGALARLDLGNRSVYGLQSDTFHNEVVAAPRINEFAITYTDRIQGIQPQGPYHLLGWSVGGILAHAIAVELQNRGAQVGVLSMLDAYPSSAWRAQPLPAPNAVYKALLHIAGYDPDELPHVALERQGVIDFLRSEQHPLGALADPQLNGVLQAVMANNHAVRLHKETFFAGDVLYFQAGLDHKDTPLTPSMWQPWVQELKIHTLPFLHAHLTSPDACAFIAPLLRTTLM